MDDAGSDRLEKSLLRWRAFADAIARESDRGCVICAAAYIDDALEHAIRSYLHKLSKAPKSLLDSLLTRRPQPPLGAFAVRTKMARALNLIDDSIMTSIDGLRPMRNDSAHLGAEFSFDSYNLDEICAALSTEERAKVKEIESLPKVGAEKHPKRLAFEAASASVFYRLILIASQPDFWAKVLSIPGADIRNMAPDGDPDESLRKYLDPTPATPEWLESVGFKRVTRRKGQSNPSSDDKDCTENK